MVVTLGEQYSVGEKPTVILYTYYMNRHAGTQKKINNQKQCSIIVHTTTNKNNQNNVVRVLCVAIPFILNVRIVDVPAGVTQEEGRTGFLHLPSVVLALVFSGEKDSAVPFPRRP